MKKATLYLLIICAIYFILDFALYTGLSTIYAHTYVGETGGKIKQYLSLEQPCEIVIMGASRALNAINPEHLSSKSFNLSHSGSDPYFLACLVAIACEEEKRPKTILFSIVPYQYTTPNGNNNWALLKRLKPWYKDKPYIKKFIDEKDEHERIKLAFSRSYAFNGMLPSLLNNFVKSLGKQGLSNGFESHPVSSRDSTVVETKFASRAHSSKPTLILENTEAIEFAIQTAREHDVEIILAILPEYRSTPDPLLTAYLQELNTKWGVKVIDYSAEPLEALDKNPALWHDLQHLNIEGSRILTQDLAERISK